MRTNGKSQDGEGDKPSPPGVKHVAADEFAAQRAVNAKDYLVTEQGIDASRITAATGATDGQTEENYLVPASPVILP